MAMSKKEIEYDAKLTEAKSKLAEVLVLMADMCKLYPRSSAAKEAYYAADKASEHLEDC